jgi:hypothetical protein
VKHKYLVMWHPVLGWGAPVPSLHRNKTDVFKATGLTPQRIRQQGWKWLPVWIDAPDGIDGIVDNTGGPKVGPPEKSRQLGMTHTIPPGEAVDADEVD